VLVCCTTIKPKLTIQQVSALMYPGRIALTFERRAPSQRVTIKHEKLPGAYPHLEYARTVFAVSGSAAMMLSAYHGYTWPQSVVGGLLSVMLGQFRIGRLRTVVKVVSGSVVSLFDTSLTRLNPKPGWMSRLDRNSCANYRKHLGNPGNQQSHTPRSSLAVRLAIERPVIWTIRNQHRLARCLCEVPPSRLDNH
jgi:hypothetical protein